MNPKQVAKVEAIDRDAKAEFSAAMKQIDKVGKIGQGIVGPGPSI